MEHERACCLVMQVLQEIEREEDINQVREYFSYEHFYVIYCKFWELDADHDLLIDAEDLAKYSEHGNLAQSFISTFECLFALITHTSDFTL